MNKQKSRLSLGFSLLFTGCLVSATPLKGYAGKNVVRGTSVESSTFSGDSFNGTNQGAPTLPPELGTGVSIEGNGTINVSLEIQQSLNIVASNIVQSVNSGSTSNLTTTIVAILLQGSTADTAINQVQTSLSSLGVSQSLITTLLNNLAGLFQGFNSAATSSVPMAEVQLQPVQLVASTQLAQGRESSKVDINQLNAAIKAYNDIVLKSDAQTLNKLSKNAEFVEIGRVLKELRVALKGS